MIRESHAHPNGVDGRDPLQPPELPVPRRNYARWRALSLSLVYVVFALHILHWKTSGKTLAPLELNEVMYTLELGIITAGFLFMCFLVLGSLFSDASSARGRATSWSFKTCADGCCASWAFDHGRFDRACCCGFRR